MAFVYRSDLKSSFNPVGDAEIGPGYYFKDKGQEINISPNKVPFLASTAKLKEKKIDDVPGPGRYYNDEQFYKIYKKCQETSTTINDQKGNINVDVIYRALENENLLNQADPLQLYVDEHFEKLGFLSKNKRFKEINPADVPGPGSYLKAKSKSAKYKKNDKENLKKIYLASLNSVKVETIPAKNHVFGYDYDEKGELKRNEDPNKEKKFKGERGNSVGPGNYEVVKPEEWNRKGAIQWGKKSQTLMNFFKKNKKRNNSNSPSNTKKENAFATSGINFDINATDTKGGLNVNNQNMQNKTFYGFSKQKKLRGYSNPKSAIGHRNKEKEKESEIETDENNRENIRNFRAIQANNKLSQSFEIKSDKINSDTEKILRFFKEKNKKRKEILLMNHTNKLFDRSHLIKNRPKDMNPGPGYYLEDKLVTCFNVQPLPEEKQIFGSNSRRFPNYKTETLGPGAYFREDFKLDQEKTKNIKEKLMIPQMNKIKSYRPVKIEHNNMPGPGQYDPDKHKKRIQIACTNFGSKEPRFKKHTNELTVNNPGPGSYINPENWIKIDSTKNLNVQSKILMKPNSANPRNINTINKFCIDVDGFELNNICKKPRIEILARDQTPGVGAYNPDAIYTLEYKVAKNSSKNTLIEAPFYSTKSRPRFDKVIRQSPTIIGPGFYHKVDSRKNKQIYPAFNNSEMRFRDNKSQYNTNPGQYDSSSYFDWNKKTFNILYL